MPAFGRDQMLPRADVENVVSLCADALRSCRRQRRCRQTKMKAGKAVFAANCASCHGEDAQGQHGDRRAKPDRQVLDLWRRRADDLHHGLERPAGPHADLGRPPVAGRSQDPRALRRRSEKREANERETLPFASTARTQGSGLAVRAAWRFCCWSSPTRISSMWR